LQIQAAAGSVGTYLVQLAKIMGVKKVIALATSQTKVEFVRSLGADVVIDYGERDWAEQVRAATQRRGVDVVLEAASGETGRQSFELLAPLGRMVVFGARNIHDTFVPEQIQQLIYNNQTVTGFNIPSLPPNVISSAVPPLLDLIATGRRKLFAGSKFPLVSVKTAFEALATRKTIGKVVLTPEMA
jgi:NADPH2:quinone reductase